LHRIIPLVVIAAALVGCDDNPASPTRQPKPVATKQTKDYDSGGYGWGICSPCLGYHYDVSRGKWTTGVSPFGYGFGF
jgi:hypothetical protein